MKRIANTRLLGFIRHHKIISAIILIVIIGLVFILRPKQPPEVKSVTVQRGDIIQSISSTGSIDSLNSVNLSFQMGGKLVYLGAKAGDTVSAGQTIATLDQRQMQDNLTTALRDYSKQRNTFDQTVQDNGGRTPEGALNDDMKRILENNQYDLDKAVISVDLQNLAKEDSVLTTPIAGIVTRADVQTPGVNVTPATVFTVSDPASLVFKVDVDEADFGTVKLGQ
jgi:HlyD family secretion protein/macrolide-specific efflux system membrane fusion protein